MSFVWSPKDPDEEYEYTHDWAKRLLVEQGDGVFVDVGDQIHLPDDPDPAKRPTLTVEDGDVEITAIVSIPDTAKLQYWTRGGTVKSRLVGTVHTAQGRTYQESFSLKIKER